MAYRANRRSKLLYCLLLVAGLAGTREITLDAAPQPVLGFSRLVYAYSDDPAAKAEFAVAALSEMALALSVETDLARQQMASLAGDRSLSRWVVSVERYIDELLRLANAIRLDTPIKLFIGPEGNLFLLVGQHSIMVSAPRMELQASFEQRVIEQFCSRVACEDALARSAQSAPGPIAGPGAPPRWSFGEDAGPACDSDDGLVLQFEDMANLPRKREICLQLVNELRGIAAEIARLKSLGVLVQWDALAIRAIPGTEQHQLDLNSRGDALSLPLPMLATMPEQLQHIQPWLRARADNHPYTLLIELENP